MNSEEKIATMEARIKSLIATIPAGLIIVTYDGLIESISPHLESMTGYQANEVQGMHISSLIRSNKTDKELLDYLRTEAFDAITECELVPKGTKYYIPIEFTTVSVPTVNEYRLLIAVIDARKKRTKI